MSPASALLITCGILLVVVFAWSWREVHLSAKLKQFNTESKYLLREIEDQRRQRKDKVLVTAEALTTQKKVSAEDVAAAKKEWDKMWEEIFGTVPGSFTEARDEKGNFIWEDAAMYAFDMRQFRGFTHRQARYVCQFAKALKKAVEGEQRALNALTPMGEIEFDAEGGIIIKE